MNIFVALGALVAGAFAQTQQEALNAIGKMIRDDFAVPQIADCVVGETCRNFGYPTFHFAFDDNYNINSLYVAGSQMTALPSEISVLTALTQLHVPSNQLATLPSEIGYLTALKSVFSVSLNCFVCRWLS